MAMCYQFYYWQKNEKLKEKYLKRAINIYYHIVVNYRPKWSRCYLLMSYSYYKLGDYKNCLTFLEYGYKLNNQGSITRTFIE